ncbi:MAG: hypothetical protein JW722_08180 [Demequinaceae bacterium]|nr:hypothetical protein [Demequinaceae bacterium]
MSAWTGTPRLVRLALRRDRVILTVWLVAISGLIYGVISAEVALYVDEAQRLAGASFGAQNVMARIFDGPASGTSLGAMSWVEAYIVLAVLVAIMSGQAVVRHTRLDEETGRAEMIESSVVGRHARLTAALVVAAIANAVVALATTLVMVGSGLDLRGSLVASMAMAGVGMTFASVAALTSQVSTTQRGANGLVALVIGVAFFLRAVGDALGTVGPNGVEVISLWPSWLSPLGWGHQARPFYQDNWEIGLLYLGLSAVLIGIAYRLSRARDLGAGLLQDKVGSDRASSSLLSPLGLALRIHRGGLLAWGIGMSVMAYAFGIVGRSVDDFEEVSPQFVEFLEDLYPGADLIDIFSTFLMAMLAIAAAGFTLQALLRMRAEEASGRLEPILATAVDRRVWLASHGVIAGVGTAAILGAMGMAGMLGYLTGGGDLAGGWGQFQAAVVFIPSVLTLGAFVLLAFALLPRWASLIGWGALVMSLVMGQLGELLKFPQAVLNASPFTHAPKVPAEAFTALPLIILLVCAAGLSSLAVWRFRQRDLAIAA